MKLLTPDEILDQFANKLPESGEARTQLKTVIESQIAAIDSLLSTQLNEIIHHPEFRTLEASWRGLHYLVNETRPNDHLKIKVLNASKRDLLKDFERSLEFEQTSLYQRVYADVYSTFGAEPFGLLIGDYEFSNHPQDMALLERLAEVASAAHAPFISGAHPHLFGAETFSGLYEMRDPARVFDRVEYLKWRHFRELEESRYVGLCLPHILLREPYEQFSNKSFSFQETVRHETLLWGNAAYAFGCCVAKAYRESGWCGLMRDYDSDGAVEGLPAYEIDWSEQSVEILIDGWRETRLADLGFLPLVQNLSGRETAFFSAFSCHRAKRYDTEQANIHARASSKLPYTLAMSRFAHYLKVMVRDRSAPFESVSHCQNELNRWLSRYFHSIGEIGDELRARFPLSDTRIDVRELPDNSGKLRGIAFLRPAYQLEELPYSLRMVVELPKTIWKN